MIDPKIDLAVAKFVASALNEGYASHTVAAALDAEGYPLPCALCRRAMCDHLPSERPDSWDNMIGFFICALWVATSREK